MTTDRPMTRDEVVAENVKLRKQRDELAELLKGAVVDVCLDHGPRADDVVSAGSKWACGICYECRARAALAKLEENDAG